MKLFSLKKDNDSIAPTSEDANPSSPLAENPTTGVSDNPLQLDTTNQPPMQATNYPDMPPDTSPKTAAIKNAEINNSKLFRDLLNVLKGVPVEASSFGIHYSLDSPIRS